MQIRAMDFRRIARMKKDSDRSRYVKAFLALDLDSDLVWVLVSASDLAPAQDSVLEPEQSRGFRQEQPLALVASLQPPLERLF